MSVQKFTRDKSGNIAVIFALVAAALMSVMGLSIDLQRSVSAEQSIQSALDASTLAGVRALGDGKHTEAEIKAYVTKIFETNLTSANANLDCPAPAISIDAKAGTVKADASCTLPTTIAGLFAIEKVTIGQSSISALNMSRLDLAMMLDVSGSMKGQKLKDLQEASKSAIDILITPQSDDRVRIAFNTYSTAVNVGSYAKEVKGSAYNKTSPTRLCATERDGSAKFDDDAPAYGKYVNENPQSSDHKPLWCPASSIEPLTTKKQTLKDQIDTFVADGWTAGHLGIAWAWYLIAPEWDAIWPKDSKPLAYNEPKTLKAVILMTDGEFNTAYEKGQGSSVTQSEKLCKNMKKNGIIIYSVAFQAPKSGKKVLQTCATSSDYFFDAKNGTDLKNAYAEIASRLSDLRLTQ